MKLTRRQETFVYKLLDLYRELDGPIHYSTLAERIGVSPFTAYDMLRLLEEKGLVTSKYRLGSDKPVRGRSRIVFAPTERAHRLWMELTGARDLADWENVKEQVLEKVLNSEVVDRELTEQMLARVPVEGPPILQYCVEIITILILRLDRGAGRQLLATYLPKILTEQEGVSRANLSLLGGFALGILASESRGEDDSSPQFFEYVRRYQSLIHEIDAKLLNRLIKHLSQVLVPLGYGK